MLLLSPFWFLTSPCLMPGQTCTCWSSLIQSSSVRRGKKPISPPTVSSSGRWAGSCEKSILWKERSAQPLEEVKSLCFTGYRACLNHTRLDLRAPCANLTLSSYLRALLFSGGFFLICHVKNVALQKRLSWWCPAEGEEAGMSCFK